MPIKAEKEILRSLTIDKHGDFFPLEVLECGAQQINGFPKSRMLVNHRRDLPPIGYWDEAEIVEKGQVLHLVARPIYYGKSTAAEHPGLIVQKPDSAVSFITIDASKDAIIVRVDKSNFSTFEQAKQLLTAIKGLDPLIGTQMETRKVLIPDPQLSIGLATYYHDLYPVIAYLGAKAGDVVLDEVIGDSYKELKKKATEKIRLLVSLVRLTRKKVIPKNKVLTTIFEIHGDPYIELFAKTDDADLIAIGLTPAKLLKVHTRIEELNKLFPVKEAYFKLNEKGNWTFSYILTSDGTIYGSKTIMEKRDHLYNRIQLSPTKGFSMGGNVEFQKAARPPNAAR